jgi:O-antigen/teichoic acid export membrane protein
MIFGRMRIKLRMPLMDGMRELFSFSLPIAATSAMSAIVGDLSLIVLGIFATTSVVGTFGVASKVGTLIGVITESMVISILPAFASTAAAEHRKESLSKFYNYAIYISMVLVMPLMLSMALLSRQFALTAFSSKYPLAQLSLYISVVSIGALIGIAGSYTSTLLISANKVKELLKNTIFLTAIQLVSLFILVPTFKGVGILALTFVITPIASVALYTRESRNVLKIKINARRLYRVLLAGAISTLFLVPMILVIGSNYILSLVCAAIIQLLVYPPLLSLVKGVSTKDLEILKDLTGHIPVLNVAVRALANYSSAFVRA